MSKKVEKYILKGDTYQPVGGYGAGPGPPPPPRRKKKKSNKKFYNTLLIFFVLFFVGALGLLAWQLLPYYNSGQHIKDLKSKILQQASPQQLENLPHEAKETKLAPLFAEYTDFRGWITIPGTKVDHPIVQGSDNEFYLERDMNGKYLKLGTVFADYRNQFNEYGLSHNTVLHGHNGKNSTYFHDLVRYKDVSYYQKNHFIEFETMYDEKDFVIIGAMLVSIWPDQDVNPPFHYYEFFEGDEKATNDFLAQVKRRSYFTTDIPVDYTDKFLTLSTCDYEYFDPRFVVVARQLRPGESKETIKVNASKNENQYMADAWYKAKGRKSPNVKEN